MTDKHLGSTLGFETEADGTFKRACFSPNIGVRIATMSRRMYGFDDTQLNGERNLVFFCRHTKIITSNEILSL